MENEKILKLDFHTKLIYFIMHLFGPIAIFGILACIISDSSKEIPLGWISVGIGIVLGLYFAIEGIIKYRKYIKLSDNKLLICKGSIKKPSVIKEYSVNDIKNFSKSKSGLEIEFSNGEKTTVYIAASPVCTILLAGVLVIPIKLRADAICKRFIEDFYSFKNPESAILNKKTTVGNSIACWAVNLIFVAIASIVLLVTFIFGLFSFVGMTIDSYSNKYVKEYDAEIAQDPNNAELYYGRAIFKKDKESIPDYNKAIELNPKYIDAYIGRAGAKRNLEDYKGAEEDYIKALELDSGNYEAYVELGSLKLDQEDYPAAEKYLDKAIEIDPEDKEAYYYKWVLHMDYKTEQKDAAYKKYIEIRDKNKEK